MPIDVSTQRVKEREARGHTLRSKSLKTTGNTDTCTEKEGINIELHHRMQRLLRRHMFEEKERETRDFNQKEWVHLSKRIVKLLSVGFWPLTCIRRKFPKGCEQSLFFVSKRSLQLHSRQSSILIQGLVRSKKTKLNSKQETLSKKSDLKRLEE